MNDIKVPGRIDLDRRRFFGAAALGIVAAEFGLTGSAQAQGAKPAEQIPFARPGTNKSFPPLKRIDAGPLSIGYAEVGPATVPWWFFCTVGLTTFTVSSMWRRCWPRPNSG